MQRSSHLLVEELASQSNKIEKIAPKKTLSLFNGEITSCQTHNVPVDIIQDNQKNISLV
jgi:hypothetical protein